MSLLFAAHIKKRHHNIAVCLVVNKSYGFQPGSVKKFPDDLQRVALRKLRMLNRALILNDLY
jgi:hypothetical protein